MVSAERDEWRKCGVDGNSQMLLFFDIICHDTSDLKLCVRSRAVLSRKFVQT